VVVRSSDPAGKGYIGIWVWEEPDCYLKNITVQGFDTGIYLDGFLNGMTLEDIVVRNQNIRGIDINNTVVIRRLTSVNTVTAVRAMNGTTSAIMDSSLTGGASANSAIDASADSDGSIFVRNVSTSGYGTAIAGPGGNNAFGNVTEFAWPTPVSPFGGGSTSLNLPIEETPMYLNSDLTQWYNVNNAPGSTFDQKLQWAIDNSGKPVIYLPWQTGTYDLTANVYLRGSTVRQIIGLHSQITGNFSIICNGTGTYNVEHITAKNFILAGPGTMVLRHITDCTITTQSGATGKVFADDIQGRLVMYGTASVWVRRINTEYTTPEVLNQGGTLWLLGAKFEGGNQGISTTSGGFTETF